MSSVAKNIDNIVTNLSVVHYCNSLTKFVIRSASMYILGTSSKLFFLRICDNWHALFSNNIWACVQEKTKLAGN